MICSSEKESKQIGRLSSNDRNVYSNESEMAAGFNIEEHAARSFLPYLF